MLHPHHSITTCCVLFRCGSTLVRSTFGITTPARHSSLLICFVDHCRAMNLKMYILLQPCCYQTLHITIDVSVLRLSACGWVFGIVPYKDPSRWISTCEHHHGAGDVTISIDVDHVPSPHLEQIVAMLTKIFWVRNRLIVNHPQVSGKGPRQSCSQLVAPCNPVVSIVGLDVLQIGVVRCPKVCHRSVVINTGVKDSTREKD